MVADKRNEAAKPFEQVAWELLMRNAANWEDLAHPIQEKWRRQVKAFLVAWLETEFKRQLFNEDFTRTALGVLKIATQKGDKPPDIIRRVVASFVVDIVDPEKFQKTLILPE